ncbi:hypothetical protein BH11MYX4_BH11MYX4_26660 [soil metagenome]
MRGFGVPSAGQRLLSVGHMRSRLIASFLVVTPPLLAAGWSAGCGDSRVDEGVVTPDPPPPDDGGLDAASDPDAATEPVDAAAQVDAADADADAAVDPCTSPDLIACFSFEGATLEDRSPTKLAPVFVQDLTFGVGHSGQGLDVGPATILRFAPSAAFNQPNVTVEAFIKVAALPGGDQVVFDADARYSMQLQPSGGIRCNGSGDPVAGGTVAIGRWVHVACVSGGGVVRAYVDGVQVKQGGGGTAASGGQEAVACDAPSGNGRFAGSVDTLRVFKVARTAAELLEDAR